MGEVIIDLGKADWIWNEDLNSHIPCCIQKVGDVRCGNGPLIGEAIWSGDCGKNHWPSLIQQGSVVLECRGCGKVINLDFIGDNEVSIEHMNGWTLPPILCPDCSVKKELTS